MLSICALVVGATPALASEVGPGTSGTWKVRIEGTRLSVDAHNAPLGQLLSDLARQASFSVSVKERVAQELVVAHLSNVLLEEAIHTLLQGKEYAIIRAGSGVSRQRGDYSDIREVLVFSARKGAGTSADEWVEYSTPATPSITDLTQQALHAPAPAERARALEELRGLVKDEDFVSILTRALGDQDAGVRGLALDFLEDTLSPLPEGPVVEVARADESPQLRAKALSLLAYQMKDRAIEPIRQALQDPDSRVRAVAGELLDDLGVAVDEDEVTPSDISDAGDELQTLDADRGLSAI